MKEMARIMACAPDNEEEVNECRALIGERRINSRSARQLYEARVEEFRILAVRSMRDERDVYQVAKTSPDLAVRKEAIERLRFVVSLQRLMTHESHPELKARVQERHAWLSKRKAEKDATRRKPVLADCSTS